MPKVRILLGVVFAAGCVAVIVVAQQTVGWAPLGLMLLGLAGLLLLLGIYNRRYR